MEITMRQVSITLLQRKLLETMLLVPNTGTVLTIKIPNLVMLVVAAVRAAMKVKAVDEVKAEKMSMKRRRKRRGKKTKKKNTMCLCPLVMQILCPPRVYTMQGILLSCPI